MQYLLYLISSLLQKKKKKEGKKEKKKKKQNQTGQSRSKLAGDNGVAYRTLLDRVGCEKGENCDCLQSRHETGHCATSATIHI